jgi:hypothetical protein
MSIPRQKIINPLSSKQEQKGVHSSVHHHKYQVSGQVQIPTYPAFARIIIASIYTTNIQPFPN